MQIRTQLLATPKKYCASKAEFGHQRLIGSHHDFDKPWAATRDRWCGEVIPARVLLSDD
jgi:hypothetical protein